MSDKSLELKRIEIEKKYHIPGMPNYTHRKRNAIFFGSESFRHVLGKCIAAYQIRKYGDVKFSPEMLLALHELDEAFETTMKDFTKSPADFVTEVCPNEASDRRIDVLCLDNNVRYEIVVSNLSKKSENDCVVIRL